MKDSVSEWMRRLGIRYAVVDRVPSLTGMMITWLLRITVTLIVVPGSVFSK
jgi:hypothetical protein